MKIIALAAALTIGTAAAATPVDHHMQDNPTPPPPGQNLDADNLAGYQPAQPPLSGPVTPGTQVIFRPAMSPDQAYPPPQPLDSYPICEAGQYDDCRQPGN